jgi:peptidoglycan-associated lipoprotein
MSGRMMLVVTAVLLFVGSGCAKQPDMMSPSALGAGDSYADRALWGSRPDVNEYTASADLPDIHFNFDKYAIRPDAARMLEASAAWLKVNPKVLVLIEGHCDERGTSEYNAALGEQRAKTTMNYLVSRGVASKRIAVVSYGEHRPQCDQHSEACWAKNRRSHFLMKAE